jgi:hypothetical protein
MNWKHSLSILPLLAAAQQACAEAVAVPAAAVAGSAPVSVNLSLPMVIWLPLVLTLAVMVGTLVFLISRQGRPAVQAPRQVRATQDPKTRPTRVPAFART